VARDPEQRYQQMWDFYRDLESTIEELGQPVSNRQLADWIHDLMEQKKLLDPESDTSLDASGNRKKTITNLTKPEKNLNEGSNSG